MDKKVADSMDAKDVKVLGSPRGITRRDMLKYATATAAVAGAAKMGLFGPSLKLQVARAGLNQDEFLENEAEDFAVDIPGCPVASANVESIQVEDLTIDVRETTTGADWDFRTYAPGDAHYGKASIGVRVDPKSELYQWLQDASVGKNVRKNITVILKARDGSDGT